MRDHQHRWMAVVSLVALFFVGCDHARSVQPLSNEQTSTLDQRLIGGWEPVDRQQDGETSTLWVGRKPGSKKALELVMVGIADDQTIETLRMPMFVRHGQANYLSVDLASVLKEWDETVPLGVSANMKCPTTEQSFFMRRSRSTSRGRSPRQAERHAAEAAYVLALWVPSGDRADERRRRSRRPTGEDRRVPRQAEGRVDGRADCLEKGAANG